MALLPLKTLIVEDDPLDAELLVRALRAAGFAPDWQRVDNEPEFLAHLTDDVEIVLSDYNLPNFSGPRALELLQDSRRDIPFIIVSGTIGEETAVKAIKAGATDYLLKDRLARIGPAINHALEQYREKQERQAAGVALRLREEALSQVSQGVLICDENRSIIYANESFSKITGYSEDEVRGNKCSMLQGDGTDLETIRAMRDALNALRPFEGEILNYRKNGEPFWNELTISPIHDGTGSKPRFVGILRDVTTRKLEQEALKQSEQRVREDRALLRALIDSIPDLIFFKDMNSVFLGCNKAFEAHVGVPETELIGLKDEDLVSETMAEAFVRADRELLESGRTQHFEEQIAFRNGTEGIFDTLKTPYFGPGGTFLGVIGISRNITERKRSEEQMRLLLDRLRLAVKAAQAGIWDLDLQRDEASWDERMFELFGLEPDNEKIGVDRWFRHMHPGDIERCNAILREAFEEGLSYFDIEFGITRADSGEDRCIRSMAFVKFDGERNPIRITGINLDVTDERERERSLAKALEQERELAEKARAGERAKSEFLAMMSHEVRTPLNGILGYADILFQSPSLSLQDREHARIIRQSGQSLLRILDDILDFSRLESGKFELEPSPFSPRLLLEEICGLLTMEAEAKRLHIETKVAADIPEHLEADAGRLRQIMLNLIGNAIKFTTKGSVTISMRRESEDWYLFGVRDTGPGISPRQIERIFQSFTQADSSIARRFGGTGLGLTISKRLAELLGGTLEVRSEPGKGSDFTLRVPLRIPIGNQALSTASESFDAGFALRHPLRILVVEDDRVNLLLIQAILQRLGYDPMLSINGRQAVELFCAEHPDLVLMDLQMPAMDGIEATRAIRMIENESGIKTRCRIVALTANIFPADLQLCLEAGMDSYLNKPVNLSKLCATLSGASMS